MALPDQERTRTPGCCVGGVSESGGRVFEANSFSDRTNLGRFPLTSVSRPRFMATKYKRKKGSKERG